MYIGIVTKISFKRKVEAIILLLEENRNITVLSFEL